MSILIKLNTVEKNKNNKTYKDVNITELMDKPVNYDLDSIKNRIRNMFEWQQGSRILLPEFGNILEKIKYEPMTEISMKNAESLIRTMFSFEPAVSIISIQTNPNYDDNTLHIRVEYEIPDLNIITTNDFVIETAGENDA